LVIAIGAILRWAITVHVNGVNLNLIGVILMVVGCVALIVSLIMLATRRRTEIIRRGTAADGRPTEDRTTNGTPKATDDQ
jgi:hypothetical protein